MPPRNPYGYGSARTPNYNPYGQTPDYGDDIPPSPTYDPGGSTGTGFLRGVIGSIQRARAATRAEEERVQQNALKFLEGIPDTENNMAIKTSLALDILQQRPGSKGKWWQRAFGGQEAAGAYAADIYGRIRKYLPEPTQAGPPPGETRLMGMTPSGEEVSARPRRASQPNIPATVATPGPGDLGTQFQGPGVAGIPGANAGLPRESGLVGPGEIVAARPRPPQLSIGDGSPRFEFPEVGKYSIDTQTYSDDQGSRFRLRTNQRTGDIERIPLGNVRTSQEIIEEMKGMARTELARMAAAKGLMGKVLGLAAADQISPQAFNALPVEAQNEYYRKAGVQIADDSEVGMKLKRAKVGLTEAQTLESKAKAGFYDTQAQLGGVTPQQAFSDERARRQSALNAKREFDALVAEAQSAYEELQGLKNPPEDVKDLLTYDTEYFARLQQLEAKYKSKLAAAQQKAQEAASSYPGYLSGSLQGGAKLGDVTLPMIQVSPKVTQLPTMQDIMGARGQAATGPGGTNWGAGMIGSGMTSAAGGAAISGDNTGGYRGPQTFDSTTPGVSVPAPSPTPSAPGNSVPKPTPSPIAPQAGSEFDVTPGRPAPTPATSGVVRRGSPGYDASIDRMRTPAGAPGRPAPAVAPTPTPTPATPKPTNPRFKSAQPGTFVARPGTKEFEEFAPTPGQTRPAPKPKPAVPPSGVVRPGSAAYDEYAPPPGTIRNRKDQPPDYAVSPSRRLAGSAGKPAPAVKPTPRPSPTRTDMLNPYGQPKKRIGDTPGEF